ncbi:MAG: voltage-gated potassium channel [Proteobacteria bacterium]|nr:MAG: voltage-gated potassium channel [Pseudomonadota bacterium]PIE40090.1 MAG: voltage-gated potassium channel [Gammaproteobacteria bacterium]
MKKLFGIQIRHLEIFIAVLIIFSVVCFSIETLPDLPSGTLAFLEYAEIFLIFVFTIEYIIRIIAAPNRLKFIFSFYGIVDLVSILPFFIAPALDLETLRLVRLLRMIRILKLTRYTQAFIQFGKAINNSKEELAIFLFVSSLVLYFSALGIYHFDHYAQPEAFKTIFDCLWWAVSTLTTVGYGDIYPVTTGGRVFTFAILLMGLGLVAVPTGIIATSLSAIKQEKSK